MVSFQCEACGDVFTKKKLDPHTNRCRNAAFTCLDCHTTFHGFGYRSHTSCISEAQKYQGSLYQEKKGPNMNRKPPPPTVEDFVESNSDVPPKTKRVSFSRGGGPTLPAPATSPLPAATPINVFEFLEKNKKADAKPSVAGASGSISEDIGSDVPEVSRRAPAQHSVLTHPESARVQAARNYMRNPRDDPVSQTRATFDTPASARQQVGSNGDSRSEKKRKRSPSRINAASEVKDRTPIHTGLTGGLNRLMSLEEDLERQPEASPLSPKKRSKRTRDESVSVVTSKGTGEHHKGSSTVLTTASSSRGGGESHREQVRGHYGGKRQSARQPHSEFFLGLIDKDHKSIKGQSIWGALKMFHEGRQEGAGMDEAGSRAEEKRLLKGLRCKLNKDGEIVLFARPEAEKE